MSRDLMNLLWLEPECEPESLEEQETVQLLNPSGFDPGAALVGRTEDEEAA